MAVRMISSIVARAAAVCPSPSWGCRRGLVRRSDTAPVQAPGESTGDCLVAQRFTPPWPAAADQEHELAGATSGRSCRTYRLTASRVRGSCRSTIRSRRDFARAPRGWSSHLRIVTRRRP